MKLVLGTVQFGLAYGISNAAGQIPQPEVKSILNCAQSNGIDMLDTAEVYGDAEQLLGQNGVSAFDVVGKLGPIKSTTRASIKDEILSRVQASLGRIDRPAFHGVMLHDSSQMLTAQTNSNAIAAGLQALKDQGLTRNVGISVYTPEDVTTLLDMMPIDIIQLPLPPIDNRWNDSGVLQTLNRLGIETHIRSVFLQGLLLMPQNRLPNWATRWGALEGWQTWVQDHKLTPLEAAIGLSLKARNVDRIVIGVESKVQLEEIITATRINVPELPADLMTADPELLNPSLWLK